MHYNMATDIVGADRIIEVIRKNNRNAFAIMRPGQSLQQPAIYEYEGNNAEDAAQQFQEWATLFGSSDNCQRYEMQLFTGGTDYENLTSEQKRSKKFKSKLVFTFQLHEYPGQRNEKGQPIVVSGPKEHDLSGYVKATEVPGLIGEAVDRAIEKERTNNILQNLSAEVASLRKQVTEKNQVDDDDDDDDVEVCDHCEAELTARDFRKNKCGECGAKIDEDDFTEMEMVEKVGNVVDKVIKTGKDAYLEIKGNDGKKIAGAIDKTLVVNGPDEAEVKYTEADYGKCPAYLEKPIHEDQQIKVQTALAELYKVDGHLGDDLALIAKMAKDKPKKFQGLILSLRED